MDFSLKLLKRHKKKNFYAYFCSLLVTCVSHHLTLFCYLLQTHRRQESHDKCNLILTGGPPRRCLCSLTQIRSSVNSPLRRALLHYAVRRKQAELRSGVVRNNSLWDKLVFNKIQVSG